MEMCLNKIQVMQSRLSNVRDLIKKNEQLASYKNKSQQILIKLVRYKNVY